MKLQDIVIKEAETPVEKRQAHRVRFQCLTLESGDSLHADFREETFSDALDEPDKSTTMIATYVPTGDIVATQRITFRSRAVFLADHLYDFAEIARLNNVSCAEIVSRTVLYDRIATISSFRGASLGITEKLFLACQQIVRLAMPEAIMVAFVNINNVRAVRVLTTRFGFTALDKKYNFNNKEFMHLFKLL